MAAFLSIVVLAALTGPLSPSGSAPPSPPGPASADPPRPTPTRQEERHVDPSPAAGLEESPSWAARAIACMRLEGSKSSTAVALLRTLWRDPDPRVRAFALVARAARGDPPTADSILADKDPRVIRAALRAGLLLPEAQLQELVTRLIKIEDPAGSLLGLEIGAFIDDDRFHKRMMEEETHFIMRLDRARAGAYSPRLVLLTGHEPGYRENEWQRWWQVNTRERELRAIRMGPEQAFSALDELAFVRFAEAFRPLTEKKTDLAICLDSTSSMWFSFPETQAACDLILRWASDLVPSTRLGVVTFRDRRSEYLTKSHPFSTDLPATQKFLWDIVAEKGGNAPESVYEGLEATYKLEWTPGHRAMVILVGDGAPHPGTRGPSADLAKEAKAKGTTTFVVSTRRKDITREVKGFADIAEAGGGKICRLDEATKVLPNMLGGDFSDAFVPLLEAFEQRCELLAR